MNDPRRTDDVRLSTADLAAAGERANERTNERTADQTNAQRQPQPAQPGQAAAGRPASDRDVSREVQRAQHDQQAAAASRQAAEQERPTPMFGRDETNDFHQRWVDIQTG